jgi:hypothetical protein
MTFSYLLDNGKQSQMVVSIVIFISYALKYEKCKL